jgi:pyruvate,orthophosphate dikinase
MVGTNATSSITSPLSETGGRVLGNGDAKDQVVQAIVPFGGSAPPVPNPNKSILGGKGLGLQEMSSIGIAVPPGFTLTTPLCQVFQESNDLTEEMWAEVELAIQTVEADMGRKFGDAENPLLFSCRSGAAVSMPGMMDTVLNIVSTVPYIDI